MGGRLPRVLARADDDDAINEFIADVQKELKILNEAAKSKYDLQICIGIAKTDTIEDRPLKELLVAADEKLYDKKRTR